MNLQKTPHPIPPRNHRRAKLLLLGLLACAVVFLIVANRYFAQVPSIIEHQISLAENFYQQWLEQQNVTNPIILYSLAFLGGLIASLSPCILALLPVNLSYIGTLQIKSRWDAFTKAGLFVLGTVTVLSLFGLFASFATAVIVDFRGYINIVVGVIILLMGLSFAGIFHLPLPRSHFTVPVTGPYGIGLTFALVSSPCASPVLFAVLAIAASSGSIVFSIFTMLSYALGYTAVIFFASLFTGLVKQSRVLLSHSEWVMRLGSIALILAGGYYIVTGIGWFF